MVMEYMQTFKAWFWHERHWFPPGVNWSQIQSTEFEKYPDFGDLWYPLFYALVIIAIRFAFEWCIARPLGRFLGIKDTSSCLPELYHQVAYYFTRIKGKVDDSVTANGHVGNGFANIHRRKRTKSGSRVHLVHHKSLLDKFAECCWRFTYYLGIFSYGIWVLWDKPWFWDTLCFWQGYPFQPLHMEIWYYYMIEAGFYWSLTISQFFDVQRKDFWVNFVHHIATILLIYFSWADNFVRVGTMVLVVHDAVDFWMEAAKMARYCKQFALCNALFCVFTVVWFITRMGIYPFRIIYSALVEAPAFLNFYSAYYTFNLLLLVLQVLHIFWSVLILRIVVNVIKSGEADDVRSDDEESDDELHASARQNAARNRTVKTHSRQSSYQQQQQTSLASKSSKNHNNNYKNGRGISELPPSQQQKSKKEM